MEPMAPRNRRQAGAGSSVALGSLLGDGLQGVQKRDLLDGQLALGAGPVLLAQPRARAERRILLAAGAVGRAGQGAAGPATGGCRRVATDEWLSPSVRATPGGRP